MKKSGRPQTPQRRDKAIKITLTADEYAAVVRAAKTTPPAVWCRAAVMAAASSEEGQ